MIKKVSKNETAFITGASSGIGWEFAKIFAENNYNLVLTARRKDRLKKLKIMIEKEYGVKVHTIPYDLTKSDAAEYLFNNIKSGKIDVDVLVNNAGLGTYGKFHQTEMVKLTETLQVNCIALVQLTRLFIGEMIKRKKGRILNVASMAAFVPGPLMSVYYASKSFVLTFSEAISNELKGTGVHVTALCPGPVKSEFALLANHVDPEKIMKQKIPSSFETAKFGFAAMQKNKIIAINGFSNKILPIMWRILPRSASVNIVRTFQNFLEVPCNK